MMNDETRNNIKKLKNLLLFIGFEYKASPWDECYTYTGKYKFEFIVDVISARYRKNIRLMILVSNCWENFHEISGSMYDVDFNWKELFMVLDYVFSVEIRKNKIKKLINENR